jgi:hypothetical protein
VRARLAAGAALFVALDLLITALTDPPGRVPPLRIDPNTGVPQVPTNADFPYDRSNTVVTIIVLGGIGLIGLAFCLREAVRRKDYLPLFTCLGTALIVVPEVFVDIVGMVYYPVDGADHAYTIFGRQMGWFIVAAWFGAGGACATVMLRALQRRPSAGQVWALLAAVAVAYTVLEEILQQVGGMYHYYGNQPMWWNNLPLWWTPCNTIGSVLLPAAFAIRYRSALTGWRAASMLVVVPAALTGSYATIAMPSWIVVNGDYGWLVTELAGLSTWVLGLGMVAVVMNLFLGYQPFDLRSRPCLPQPAVAASPVVVGVAST